jgi:hypothetical protein
MRGPPSEHGAGNAAIPRLGADGPAADDGVRVASAGMEPVP